MKRRSHKQTFLAFMILTVIIHACSVPVFRFALERWERDEYRLVIASKGELSAADTELVAELNEESYLSDEGTVNMRTITIDVDAPESQEALKPYPEMKTIDRTTAFLLYPNGTYLKKVVWKDEFSANTLKKLQSTPFVEGVMNQLLKGASAVWLMVDSGNKEEDERAYSALKRTLAKVSGSIKLPEGIVETSGKITGNLTKGDVAHDPDNILKSGIPLKIHFSIARLSVDKNEPVLRAILGNIDENLQNQKDKPMVFPVFGRGRFLVPMVGDDINEEHITSASKYLTEACSCQVKARNPGVDMLSSVNWKAHLHGSAVVVDRTLPPVIGTGAIIDSKPEVQEMAGPVDNKKSEVAEPPSKAEPPKSPSSSLSFNLLLACGTALLIILAGGLKILGRS